MNNEFSSQSKSQESEVINHRVAGESTTEHKTVQAPGDTGAQTAEQRLNELLMYSREQDRMGQSNGVLEPDTASYYTSEMYEIIATLRAERERHAREVERLRAELRVRMYDYGWPARPEEHRGTPSWDEGYEDGWRGRPRKSPYQGSSTAAYIAAHARGSADADAEINHTLATPPTEGTPAEVSDPKKAWRDCVKAEVAEGIYDADDPQPQAQEPSEMERKARAFDFLERSYPFLTEQDASDIINRHVFRGKVYDSALLAAEAAMQRE